VVERDPTLLSHSSATYSAGGIRQQFSLRENVEMSKYGRDFLRRAEELLRRRASTNQDVVDVQFHEHGYLFLATTEAGAEQLRKNHQVQSSAGLENDILLLNRDELSRRFPWMYCDDVQLASYGLRGEGWFDPHSLINALKAKNIDLGVEYVRGKPISAERSPDGRVVSVDVQQQIDRTSTSKGAANSANTIRYNVQHVVNAAGARANDVMMVLSGNDLRYPIPVKARKRSMFYFHCGTSGDPSSSSSSSSASFVAPLTIDPTTNVYFRSEGGGYNNNFVCGASPTADADDPDIDLGAYDSDNGKNIDAVVGPSAADHRLFDDVIWPSLYHRVPGAFGNIKVKSSWAGVYEYNTLDQNAIIDFHPELPNVLVRHRVALFVCSRHFILRVISSHSLSLCSFMSLSDRHRC